MARPKKVKETPVAPVTPEPETPVVPETPVTPGGTRARREVTADTVDSEFTELLTLLKEEMENLKTGNNIKGLRALNRRLKVLQSDARRVSNGKKRKPASNGNVNSAFVKPVDITDRFAKFFGLEPGSQLSRTEGGKLLSTYINDNKLKNPAKGQGREIFPNKELKKLLGYKPKDCITETNPEGKLYYSTINSLMQQHFRKVSQTDFKR